LGRRFISSLVNPARWEKRKKGSFGAKANAGYVVLSGSGEKEGGKKKGGGYRGLSSRSTIEGLARAPSVSRSRGEEGGMNRRQREGKLFVLAEGIKGNVTQIPP